MAKSTKFEDLLANLEEVVEKIENSDVSLEETIKLYEKGMKLSDECDKFLKDAEQKITILSKNNGEITETDFDYDK